MLSHQLVFCWKNAGVAAAGWWWWGGCISLRELTSVHSWEVAGIERAADSFTRAHSGYETSPGQNSMLQYLLCEWANAAGDCSLFPPPCLDWRELPHLSSASSGIWTDCQQQSRFWFNRGRGRNWPHNTCLGICKFRAIIAFSHAGVVMVAWKKGSP